MKVYKKSSKLTEKMPKGTSKLAKKMMKAKIKEYARKKIQEKNRK